MKAGSLWTRDFIFLTIANLLMAIAFYFMTPTMALFMTDRFEADERQIGLVMFSFTIAAILMRPLAGYLLDSFKRYRIYVISYLLFTALFVLYPPLLSFALLLLLRFAHGLSWGALNTAGYTLAVDMIPEKRRGEGLGFFGIYMNAAMAIGPVLALFVVQQSSYDALFYVAAGFCVAGFVLICMLKPPSFLKTSRQKFKLSALFERKALPVSINIMFVQIPYGGIISFMALYGREIGLTNSGSFFLLLAVGLASARALSGCFFDRFGPRNVSFTGIILLLISLLLLALKPGLVSFHAAAIGLGLGFGSVAPVFQAIANNGCSPERRGAANSTYLMFFDTGVGLGMLLFGVLIRNLGYTTAFYASVIAELTALIFFIYITLPQYKKHEGGKF